MQFLISFVALVLLLLSIGAKIITLILFFFMCLFISISHVCLQEFLSSILLITWTVFVYRCTQRITAVLLYSFLMKRHCYFCHWLAYTTKPLVLEILLCQQKFRKCLQRLNTLSTNGYMLDTRYAFNIWQNY